MAITSGFFNSVNGDRTYNADDMNEIAKGLISDSGVFENVGDKLQVVAAGGMAVNVLSGRARVKGHWVDNSTAESVTLSAADVTRSRWDAVVLRYSNVTRDITINVIEGTPATTPVKPDIVRSTSSYDICLAYVLVGKGVTAITQADITDARLNSDVCGYIVGLVEQLDTSQFYAQMEAWQEQKKAEFDLWFSTLTSQLGIITHLTELRNVHTTTAGEIIIPIGITDYAPETDILFVTINGVLLTREVDYTITTNDNINFSVSLAFMVDEGNTIEFRVIKSNIGIS